MTRVLIVDDHPLVARATANEVRMVKREAETRLAHSIEEAERVIAEWEEPDTILLDLRLPDTDGTLRSGTPAQARTESDDCDHQRRG